MKRKLTFGTIILTAFLLCGCTTGDGQDGGTPSEPTTTQSPNPTETPAGTDENQNVEQMQEDTQMQGTDQMQEDTQIQDTQQSGNNETSQNNTPQNGDAQGTMISEEEAKKLALSFIEITNDDVTFIKCDLDDDDGRVYYDVEFYTLDQNDYDFEIDAYTGEIIEWDVEPIYDVNS